MASKSYSMKNTNKVPQGIALRLRRICDTTEKYESRADEQKNYLLVRDYKTSLVDEQFKKIGQISREDARSKPKTNQVSKIKFVTKYNPMLPKTDCIITKDISIQHSHNTLKTLFPKDCFSNIYKTNKSLKELIVPSIYSNKINTKTSCIISCITAIFAKIAWFLITPLIVQSLVSLISEEVNLTVKALTLYIL